MSDEDAVKHSQQVMQSESTSDLDDKRFKTFSPAADCSHSELNRVRALFVAKVFRAIHHQPVRHFDEKWTFGRWLEAIRESVRLTREDIADAIGKDVLFVEQLENGEVLPWECSSSDIADLVCLFRIHINAVLQLLMSTIAVGQIRCLGSVGGPPYERHLLEPNNKAVRKAFDLYLARNADTYEMSESISDWLDCLRQDLKSRSMDLLL